MREYENYTERGREERPDGECGGGLGLLCIIIDYTGIISPRKNKNNLWSLIITLVINMHGDAGRLKEAAEY